MSLTANERQYNNQLTCGPPALTIQYIRFNCAVCLFITLYVLFESSDFFFSLLLVLILASAVFRAFTAFLSKCNVPSEDPLFIIKGPLTKLIMIKYLVSYISHVICPICIRDQLLPLVIIQPLDILDLLF